MGRSYEISQWENGVLIFTITRESRRNAVNFEVMDGLKEAIKRAKDPHVKALVITGEGEQAFCSGGDLTVFHDLKTEDEAYGMLSRMGAILYELMLIPKPTIALMNGTAVGGGCEIAAACDFRVARKGIKAGFIQGKLAITTGWGGGTILLEKLAPSNGFKMLMESKQYSVEELVELGFIQYTYEGDALAGLQSSLGSMFEIDENVLRSYKEMLTRKWDEHDIKERIEKEIRRCAILWERDAHHQQVDKFLKK